MAHVIPKSKAYLSESDNVKICPHCKEMISYSFSDKRVSIIGLTTQGEYVICPNCQHEITIELISTEHM